VVRPRRDFRDGLSLDRRSGIDWKLRCGWITAEQADAKREDCHQPNSAEQDREQ
jgi:hypothetical protein